MVVVWQRWSLGSRVQRTTPASGARRAVPRARGHRLGCPQHELPLHNTGAGGAEDPDTGAGAETARATAASGDSPGRLFSDTGAGGAEDPDTGVGAEVLPDGARHGSVGGLAGLHILGHWLREARSKSRDWTVVLAGEHTTEHLSIPWVQIL
ncbi:hypothetical protein SORBI_3006G037000 [Sorghum bicolor]|uniref:Uncharacterized protein n=1 Tax=Sorghum bicolor TaxID=4558 RepID=A0A1B6PJX1_SORBI|nr:hypothetical protein SORBI_3006G037000 [Sorghum bicolor]